MVASGRSSSAFSVSIGANHGALAVVKGGGDEVGCQLGVAAQSPRGGSYKHIDLAGSEDGETFRRGEGAELDRGGIAEDRRGDTFRDVDL